MPKPYMLEWRRPNSMVIVATPDEAIVLYGKLTDVRRKPTVDKDTKLDRREGDNP